jgi:hypothetical protein
MGGSAWSLVLVDNIVDIFANGIVDGLLMGGLQTQDITRSTVSNSRRAKAFVVPSTLTRGIMCTPSLFCSLHRLYQIFFQHEHQINEKNYNRNF